MCTKTWNIKKKNLIKPPGFSARLKCAPFSGSNDTTTWHVINDFPSEALKTPMFFTLPQTEELDQLLDAWMFFFPTWTRTLTTLVRMLQLAFLLISQRKIKSLHNWHMEKTTLELSESLISQMLLFLLNLGILQVNSIQNCMVEQRFAQIN